MAPRFSSEVLALESLVAVFGDMVAVGLPVVALALAFASLGKELGPDKPSVLVVLATFPLAFLVAPLALDDLVTSIGESATFTWHSCVSADILDFNRALERVLIFAEDAFVADKSELGSFRGDMMEMESIYFAVDGSLNLQIDETKPRAELALALRP